MVSEFWKASTPEQLENCFRFLGDNMPEAGWRIEYKPWTGRRTLDQNALSHVWYNEISKQLGEGSPMDARCECKLRYGVPILRAEDAEFRAFYDLAIKGLTYEQKLAAMTYVPVTSIMTKDQKRRYLDHVQQAYAQRGVRLEVEIPAGRYNYPEAQVA